MPEPEPTTGQIWREVAIYAALVLLVGVAFVALRVAKDGPQVLTATPHSVR